ncbi:MAG TPA: hypothetical protein VFA17_07620 [Thermoplasmata archaeon]|nr:hypothetical protein [Thermoplasmata archaeon]
MGESDEEPERRRPEPPPVEFVRSGEPAAPLPPRDQPPAAWVPRPEDYFRPTGPPPAPTGAPGQLHIAAALLLVLSALVAIGWTVTLSVRFLSPSDYANATSNLTATEWALGQVCGLIGIWGQSTALLAGLMAYRRLHWGFAMGCATVSIVAIGLSAAVFADAYFGGAAALGLVGVLMLVRARREFAS